MTEIDGTLHIECLSAGLKGFDGCDNSGMIHHADEREDLVEQVRAAHGQPLTSPECQKLRDRLGKDSPEWAAYVEARNAPQRQERQRRYREEADPLIMKALETAQWTKTVTADASRVILEIDEKAWIEWKAKKEAIRTELPYDG